MPKILLGKVQGGNGVDGYTPIKGIDYFDGIDGYTPIKGVDYVDGKNGIDGVDGESAYQQAVKAGYIGTETQFTKDLMLVSGKVDKQYVDDLVGDIVTIIEKILE